MNLSVNDLQTIKDVELNVLNKPKTLNPHAAEFVPSALRAYSVGNNVHELLKANVSENPSKSFVNQADFINSNNSDEEVHQYWQGQLPDDITPDFKFMAGDEHPGPSDISLASLSLLDDDMSRFSSSKNCKQLLDRSHDVASQRIVSSSSNNNMLFYIPECGEEQSLSAFLTSPTSPWSKQLMNYDDHLGKGMEGHASKDDCNTVSLDEFSGEQVSLEDSVAVHVELLAKEFPGFAAESLAEVYYANGCDLSLTIEMLTQLEVQVDSGFSGNISSKALSAPDLSSMDFPALPVADFQNDAAKYAGDDLVQAVNPCTSSESENYRKSVFGTSRSATDFASAVRKLAASESGNLKHVKNGSTDASTGDRGSQFLTTSLTGSSRSQNGDKLLNCGTTSVWLETGDAVGNIYSELRGEARDHARLRNAYFEQARQAYIIGNKALAKELSMKGQLHNVHMKAAHGKARESIFRQRNPNASNPQGYAKAQDRMIDLHGLHVSEALHVLKRELSILRSTARSASQRLQVYICVGTGHHTKGSRTPARLPAAVERYLLEEHLEFGEPQPGLLRVVIY